MARICVWVPDELLATARDQLPDVKMSRVLQEGLRARLDCGHEHLECSACNELVDHRQLIDVALGRFYVDVTWELRTLVQRGGTAEGAARIVKDVGGRHRITEASRVSLPRATRAERHAAKVKELPVGATRRGARAG